MPTRILSLHALGHDTGIAMFEGTTLLFSVEAERLSRVKHDSNVMPALRYCRAMFPSFFSAVDLVVTTTNVNEGLLKLSNKVAIRPETCLHQELYCELLGRTTKCVVVCHEAAHAAIALQFGNWQPNTAVLVNEGHGSFSRNSLFHFTGDSLKLIDSDFLPWYATGFGWTGISALLGLGRTPSAAGKTMALSGHNRAQHDLRALFMQLPERLHDWPQERREAAGKFLLEEARTRCGPADAGPALAWALQKLFTERTLQELAKRAHGLSAANVALSGGCALNLNTNSAIRKRFPTVVIPPACNDAGQALGAALYCLRFIYHKCPAPFSVRVNGEPLGVQIAERSGVTLDARSTCAKRLAEMLSSGKILAFCDGVSAIGPRSLGERSILAHPGRQGIKNVISERLKKRESFRPLAPIMTDDAFSRYFVGQAPSPHMLFAYDCNPGLLPEATHVDNTARIQTMSYAESPLLYEILTRFEELSGTPALINTSLNKAGRAIAYSAKDVLDDFAEEVVLDGFVFGGSTLIRSHVR